MSVQDSGVRLFVDGASGFLRDMGNASSSVDAFGKQGGVVSKTLGGLSSAVGTAAKVIGGVFIGGVTAAGAGIAFATKEAISLESAFAGVIKTTDGLTDASGALTDEGESMLQGFRDLAKTVPTSVEELMAIGELGGQLGIANDSLLGFTATIAAMGEATNLTTEEAAVGFAQLANVMGTPQDQIENMGSAVVALGNNMATTERDIFNFAQRIAGAGEIAGLTESDVFGISAAFSSVGIEAAAGGTAVQKVLLSINEAAIAGGAELETFASTAGMSVDEFATAWETDAAGAFESFVSGLGEAGDDAMGILSDLGLEDQRLIKAFLSLAQATSSTDEEISLLAESLGISSDAFAENTALADEAAARYATTESQLAIFKNTLRDIGFTIGGAVLPMFNELLENVRPLIDAFGLLVEGDLSGFMDGLGVSMENIALMFGATDEQAESFSQFVTDLIGWFSENIPLAIEELKNIWSQAWPEIQQFLSDAWDIIGPILEGIGIWLAEEGPGFIETWKQAFTEVWGVIQGVIESFVEWWDENSELIAAFILRIQEIGQQVSDWWNADGVTGLSTAWETIKSLVDDAVTLIQEYIELGMNVITGNWSGAWENIKNIFSTIGDALKTLVTGLLETIANLFGSSLEEIGQTWSDNWDNVKEIASILWEDLKQGFSDSVTGIMEFFTGLGDSISEWWTDISTGFVDWIDEIISAIKGAWQNFFNVGAEIMQGMKAGIMSAVQGIIDAVVGAVQAAIDAAKKYGIITSPSKLTAKEIGAPISEGVAVGILDKSSNIASALTGSIDKAITAAKGATGEFAVSYGAALAGVVPGASNISSGLDGVPGGENFTPLRSDPVSPVSAPAQIVQNYSNSNLTINFEGNYASNPAIKDKNDLAFVLGLVGT